MNWTSTLLPVSAHKPLTAMKKVHNLATVSPGKLEFGVGSIKLTKPYIHTIEVTHMAAKGSQREQDPAKVFSTVHNLCNVSK